jgi:exodeoxyribonuclease V alpha subunit
VPVLRQKSTQFLNKTKFEGTILRITFQNNENGWSVIKVKPKEKPSLKLTVIVSQLGLTPGAHLEFEGEWSDHPTFGKQFKAHKALPKKPEGIDGLKSFLGSGSLKGIGPSIAGKIVRRFGEDTLDILDNNPEKLIEISGISKKKLEVIKKSLEGQRNLREIMIFLAGHNIKGHLASKIVKAYGNKTIKTLKDNPYKLSQEIYGIGFISADEMGFKLGFEKDCKKRIMGGIKYILTEARNDGHCFLTRDQILEKSEELLDIQLADRIDALLKTDGLKSREGMGYFADDLFYAEEYIAKKIDLFKNVVVEDKKELTGKWCKLYCERHEISLSDEQFNSIQGIVSSPISLLTGGPGVGKTTTTRVLVKLLQAMNKNITLAAPTGRAAQRMSEVIGSKSQTIHRLLIWDPRKKGFQKDEDNPLWTDFLIIDEASMLDVKLTTSLLKALRENTQVLFIGDPDQLPSVGPGNFLGDLIASKAISTFKLTQVFRQARESKIISFAHDINNEFIPKIDTPLEHPHLWKEETREDCLFIDSDEPTREQMTFIERVKKSSNFSIPEKFEHVDTQKLAKSTNTVDDLKIISKKLHPFSTLKYNLTATDMIKKLVRETIPKYLGETEVQILSPMIKGSLGTANLNLLMQSSLNPPAPHKGEVNTFKGIFREGDRVIQRKNNYDLNVFNGDIGFIRKVTSQALEVTYGEGLKGSVVEYNRENFDELDLAYSITIHKSQGSEFPVVIIPITTSHFTMLFKNLIYTGLTRAKKLAIFVGSRRALAMAIKNDAKQGRQTALAELLIKQCSPLGK